MRGPIEDLRMRWRHAATCSGVVLLALQATACDRFFDITTPDVIEATAVDPYADGAMLSRSAFQSLAAALGPYITYTAWFTNEAWVGAVSYDRHEFGRRSITESNGMNNPGVWVPLMRGVAQGEQVLEVLDGVTGQELNAARAALTSGYGLVLEASAYCEGTMPGPGSTPGPRMTPVQILEAALARFDRAIAAGGVSADPEAASLVTAARVGKGRALLQLGRRTEAAAAVAGVATGFSLDVPYLDYPSNRVRLGNGVFYNSAGGPQEVLVVPPHYRAMNDARVPWADAGRNSQNGMLRFYTQRKYPSWSAPIRLASGLEARYIEVEAGQNPSVMLAFVNERRAAGGQAAVSTTSLTELLGHLMDQKSRDFWLEGHRMGDWRRNPSAVPNILPPGDYYTPTMGTVGTQTCFQIPREERLANPNMGG